MSLKKYVKSGTERKRYSIEYSDWLDTGETLASVTFSVLNNTVATPLVIDDVMIDPSVTLVQYYSSGGADNVNYEVLATAVTSDGQTKEATILFAVRDA